jgi:diacylglycerol kinase (ATP)
MEQAGFLVFVSKKAGHFRPDVCRELTRVFDKAGIPLKFHYIEHESDVEVEIARALKSGCRNFLAVGGDGTVDLMASHLYGHPHRLGIIPAGTANTLARVIGVPMNIKKAIKLAVSSLKTRAVDCMEVDGRLYFQNVSAGLSSKTLDRMDPNEKARLGMFSYVIGMARASWSTSPSDFEIVIDGQLHHSRAVEIHVTNTGVIGRPQYHLYETSNIGDGKVEVLALNDLSPVTVVDAVFDVFLRRKKRAIRLIGEGSEIIIKNSGYQPAQGDGDVIGPTPVAIKVIPQAINFIVPKTEGPT